MRLFGPSLRKMRDYSRRWLNTGQNIPLVGLVKVQPVKS